MHVNYLYVKSSTITYAQNLHPQKDISWSLGNPSYRWQSIYADYVRVTSNIYANTINATSSSSILNIQYDVTGVGDTHLHKNRVRIMSWEGTLTTSFKNVLTIPFYFAGTAYIVWSKGYCIARIIRNSSYSTATPYANSQTYVSVANGYLQVKSDVSTEATVVLIGGYK